MPPKIRTIKRIVAATDESPGFERQRCAECGETLEPKRAAYQTTRRIYCDSCQGIGQVKESWQPMVGARVAGMFVIDESGKISPLKRS